MVNYLRQISKKLLIVSAMVLITSFSVCSITASADDGVNQALDVMFVIDGSGSMCKTDPNRIAMAACNLFSDMCDYDQARVGYVVYSTKIEQSYPLTPLNPESSRQAIKNSINSIHYPESAGTDISLGLTRAKDMLIEGGASAEGRSPMIILLSDGKTESISDARQAVYDAELEDTLKFLKEKHIPVYTIALCSPNRDTDVDTMEEIANSTEALFFSTDRADNLSNILSQIMANRLRSSMDFIADVVGNGQAQTVEINIPNDSIYQANIIIFSSKGVSNIHLQEPGGNEVVVPSGKVTVSRSPSYDLIKLLRPSKGVWKLTLTGADKDHISINLINCYDMQFKLKADRYTVPNGDAVTFGVYCDGLLEDETDNDVFDGAEGILTITDTVTGAVKDVDLSWNGTELGTSYTFTKAGTYTVSGRIIGKDSSYDRITDEIKITVEPYQLTLVQNSSETSGVCFSPFLGIKIKNNLEIPLVNLFSWDKDATITVTPTPGGWENVCDFSYDSDNSIVNVSGIKGGNATIDLKITDSFGQIASYTVRVKVIPGWVPVLAIIVFAGLTALAVLIIRKVRAPFIKGKLKVSVSLPSEMAGMTPPEAEIDLSILNKKGKISLNAVLASNLTLGGLYTQALDGISGFVQKLYVEAGDADCSTLRLHIPAPEKGVTLQFNNAPVEKKTEKSISAGMPAVLDHSSFNGSYIITFNFGEDGWGNGSDDIFGAGNGGFGGFGGNDTASFGGFDVGNDNGGFGGFGNEGNNSFNAF